MEGGALAAIFEFRVAEGRRVVSVLPDCRLLSGGHLGASEAGDGECAPGPWGGWACDTSAGGSAAMWL